MIDLSNFNFNGAPWHTIQKDVFERIDSSTKTNVERERIFKELAQHLGVSVGAVKQDWLEYKKASEQNGHSSTAFGLIRGLDIDLWQSTNGEAFISVPVQKDDRVHLEHIQIDSPAFKEWVSLTYNELTGGVLKDDSISDVVRLLKAEARKGNSYEIFTRVGWLGKRVYIDLANQDWEVIEIDEHGFRLLSSEESPVRFRRNPYQKPLPKPKVSKDGLFRALKLLGIKDRRQQTTIYGWVVGVFLKKGPYPPLLLVGEKGSGKSTLAKFLKRLIDPAMSLLLFEPKNEEDLFIATLSNHVLVFDNLSGISTRLSDAISRLSTGAGIAKRKLYTDTDVVLIDAARPVIITGIALGALRDDFGDRVLRIELKRIPDEERLTDEELETELERLLPEALGHVLLAVSQAIRDYEKTRARLKTLPRMSSWAVWAEAAHPAFDLKPGEIVDTYYEVQAALNTEIIESDPVAQAILKLYDGLAEGVTLEYSSGELLRELERVYIKDDLKGRIDGWPRNPMSLSKRLPRLLEALRRSGVVITSKRSTRTKNLVWVVSKTTKTEDSPRETAPMEVIQGATPPHQVEEPSPKGAVNEYATPLFKSPSKDRPKRKSSSQNELKKLLAEEEKLWNELYKGESLSQWMHTITLDKSPRERITEYFDTPGCNVSNDEGG